MFVVTLSRPFARLLPVLAIVSTGRTAQVPSEAPVRLSPTQITDRITHCGVPLARVIIRADRDLQEDVIAIASGSPLSEAELACIARASLAALTYVEFDDADQQKRYDAVYHPIEDSDGVTKARAWLGAHGLLTKLPSYDPTRQSLAAYGHELEALCGIPRGAVLVAIGSTLTIRHNLLEPITDKPFHGALSDAQLECLLYASAASNMNEHGAGFGFIGNAAVSDH